jgi:hypothetical protein
MVGEFRDETLVVVIALSHFRYSWLPRGCSSLKTNNPMAATGVKMNRSDVAVVLGLCVIFQLMQS